MNFIDMHGNDTSHGVIEKRRASKKVVYARAVRMCVLVLVFSGIRIHHEQTAKKKKKIG